MVDLMMWLVIAAMLLAAAIQGIGYYQQAAYAYQAKNDVSHGHGWAAANTSLTSKLPTTDDMKKAMESGDFKISNPNDIAMLAVQGQTYCLGVKAGNVKGNNVFYATSQEPSKIIRDADMPESCGDIIQVRGPKAPSLDADSDGINDELDEDINGDGLLNVNDPDVDGDGILNGIDTDIDGDGTANADDDTASGTPTLITFVDPVGTPAIDPRIGISDANFLPDQRTLMVMLTLNLTGVSNLTGPYFNVSVRLTCQLDDGTRYYEHTWLQSSYKGNSNPNPTYNFVCPVGTVVGYIVGAPYADPALTDTTGQKGPKNVGMGGDQTLTGNTVGVPSFGTLINPRVALRSVTIASTGDAITIGRLLHLGGVGTSGSSTYYGVSWRMTCELPDGSQFYKHGNLYASYVNNSSNFPAPDYLTPVCGGGAKTVGYVAGTAGGDPALTSSSGQPGPTNTIASGVQTLTNDPGIAPINTGFDPRISVRNVTYNGATANIGFSLELGGASNTGKYWGYSYRLTCESTTGVISYITGALYTTYDRSTFPAPAYASKACPTGSTVVGHVVGQDRAHAALTYNSGQPGPKNVLVGGKQ
jgi:hypothetical protein